MKAILMSDRAYWCMLMMNKEKKVEVRKGTALYKAIQKLIDEYGYADIYVYCTKGKPNLWLPYEYDCFELDEASQPYLSDKPIVDIDTKMNGKVIFKFRCYKVEEIECYYEKNIEDNIYSTKELKGYDFLDKTQLKQHELYNYFSSCDDYIIGTAIHISDLEIFDRPKELNEFKICCKRKFCNCFEIKCMNCSHLVYEDENLCDKRLTKAPQSWCYVEVEQ